MSNKDERISKFLVLFEKLFQRKFRNLKTFVFSVHYYKHVETRNPGIRTSKCLPTAVAAAASLKPLDAERVNIQLFE